MEKKITRNDYYNLIMETGKIPKDGEYEILPLDLSRFGHLTERTVEWLNKIFTEETLDKNGEYMLKTHNLENQSYLIMQIFKMNMTMVDGCSAYAFSDDEMMVYTYCEGDMYMTLFDDREKYAAEKKETIRFYKEEY